MKGWETRWEALIAQGREDELGPKGREYFDRNYGESYEPEEPPYDIDYDYDYEFDIEY